MGPITHDDFIAAMNIVESYIIQCREDVQFVHKETVYSWIKRHEPVPRKVRNVLEYCDYSVKGRAIPIFTYMDEVNERSFSRIRGVGKKTWMDFNTILNRKH